MNLLRKIFPTFLTVKKASIVDRPSTSTVSEKQILYDVSELAQRDFQSGIQRVVRQYLQELLRNPPENYRIEPIYGNNKTGIYYYARKFTSKLMNNTHINVKEERVEVKSGDIFLGIDLVILGMKQREKTYRQWKNKGVSFFFMVYDLLCVQHPEFFLKGADKNFVQWLNVVTSVSNGLICISKTVANALNVWLEEHKVVVKPTLSWVHLGADLPKVKQQEVMTKTYYFPTILTVGTLEIRKGYDQMLKAFELLWKKNIEVHWIIVGSVGWKTEKLIRQLRKHPERNHRLFWFEKATDTLLDALYQNVHGCLIASEGEGFGLPLIEAAQYQQPLLVRDIPVFREVAGKYATYFSENSPEALAEALSQWLEALRQQVAITSTGMPYLTWKQSTEKLLEIVLS